MNALNKNSENNDFNKKQLIENLSNDLSPNVTKRGNY